jgi:hypothetical protein
MEPEELFSWYGTLIYKLPLWIWKPLGGCLKCFCGQILFWYYIFTFPYNLKEHLFFVSLGILFSIILNKTYVIIKT